VQKASEPFSDERGRDDSRRESIGYEVSSIIKREPRDNGPAMYSDRVRNRNI